MLTPAFGAEFAFYHYPIRNAGKFSHGDLTDFAQVGVRTLDESTLEVSLENPTPYFLNVLARAPFPPGAARHGGAVRPDDPTWHRLDARGQPYDPEEDRRLLAEAGFPGGKGFPPLEMLIYTTETYRVLAEAVQQMWRKELGIEVGLANQEWKVYLATRTQKNYAVAEAGWTTVYLDPNGFMDLFVKDSPVNQMNWSHPEFEAARTLDPAARAEHLQRAEAVLLEQAPSVPLCHLTRAYLLAPGVRDWSANLFDEHPYKFVSLEPAAGR